LLPLPSILAGFPSPEVNDGKQDNRICGRIRTHERRESFVCFATSIKPFHLARKKACGNSKSNILQVNQWTYPRQEPRLENRIAYFQAKPKRHCKSSSEED